MTSESDRQAFKPLPGRTTPSSTACEAVLRDLLPLVGAEIPAADQPDVKPSWRHRARRAVGKAVAATEEAPEEWFEPLMQAAVLEPDSGFSRELVKPAITAFGRRRVQLALLDYLDKGTAADVAGATRAWHGTEVQMAYEPGSKTPTPESLAEWEESSDLRERYQQLREQVEVRSAG
ncbi:hypothetical protein [Lentzea sp. NPDC092896]|uniref:hypothetical protein n=1 Tax=Lentzea sp. NPDC092896 TaxID=3364127 RepID=UPI003814F991